MPSRRKVPTPASGAFTASRNDENAPGAAQESPTGLFQALFEQAAVGIIVLDAQTLRILQVNARFCAMTGYLPEALIGRPIEEITHPEDVAADQEARERLSAGRKTPLLRREKRYRHADGSVVWVQLTISLLRDAQGELIAYMGIVEDISERKRLEQRTLKSLEALLQMAHTLTQPTASARQAGEDRSSARTSALLRHLAELACQVLGCERLNLVLVQPETEMLEPLALVGVPPEQEQMWRARMQRLALREYLTADTIDRLKAGEPVLVGPDQRLLPIQTPSLEIAQFLVAPLLMGERLLGGMSLDYGEDHRFTPDELVLARALGNLVALLLEREQLVQASHAARQQVETLEQEKAERETFISLVAHELRTPLTVISGQAQFMERHMHDEARRAESLRKIRVQTKRLQRLIDDLLDVSRIASGTFEMPPDMMDLCALAKSTVEEQHATTQHHTLRLEAPSEPLMGLWDRQRLSQALSNLLSNAIKYSEGGEVHVRIRLLEEGVQVSVQDQGVGLTAEEISQLFQLYSRLQRTRKIAGNGLGLYLTRGIIEAHGGRIRVSSPGPDQGSTFTFTLPWRRARE
jgi:PAS domain S-box-containing protein